MSSKYERELRDILMGNRETLDTITKTMDDRSTKIYRHCMEKPFLVMRGAGSLGIDLFVFRGDVAFAIEEKSSSGTLYFTDDKRLEKQHQQFEKYAEEMGLAYIYAYRTKGRSGEKWSTFNTEKSHIERILTDASRLPQIPKTSHGNKSLHHEDGLPLSEFLTLIKGRWY